MRFLAVLALCLSIVTPLAHAAPPACNAGAEGTIVYNKDQKLVQFCNGSQWIGMVAAIGSGVDTLANLSCASGEVPEWNGTDWVCGAGGTGLWTDSGSGYLTYTGADKGILLHPVTGMAAPVSTLADLGCSANEILKWDGTAWGCAADASGSAGITALTGEVTASGTGSVAATIGANTVTNAKMADDAVGIAELSATGTASATTYLRGDNTWTSIPSSLWLNDGPGAPAEAYYNAGNVGIGTNDPLHQLDVRGTAAGGIFGQSGIASSFGVYGRTQDTAKYGILGYDNRWAFYGAGDVYVSGDVGIGTVSPVAKLYVNGNVNTDAAVAVFRQSGQNLISGQSLVTIDGSGQGAVTGANALRVKTLSGTGDVVIDNSGRVGIGTTGPTQKLEVSGGYSLFGGLRLHGQDASVNQIWQSNAGTVLGITANGGDISLGQTSSPGSLVVKASGNVGIGTPTPSTPLQVNGTVTATTFAGSGASLTALNATNLASGTVPTARLGSGTANSTTFLRGDNTWAAAGGSSTFGTEWKSATSAWLYQTATSTINCSSGKVIISAWGGQSFDSGNPNYCTENSPSDCILKVACVGSTSCSHTYTINFQNVSSAVMGVCGG